MLDVHPPHTPTHTWRDFLIHIATIVIGLLIAVGLEQSVEYFHHRAEAKEAREALRLERETNHSRYRRNTDSFRRFKAAVRNNLSVLVYLKQHPGTPEQALPGVLVCGIPWIPPEESAWKAAQQTGATSYMPSDEVQTYASSYYFLDSAFDQQIAAVNSLRSACRSVLIDPDPTHLSPVQIDEAIDLMTGVEVDLSRWGPILITFSAIFPDFKDGPTWNEDDGHRTPENEQQLRDAKEITRRRLDAAAPDPLPEALGR
jgi:type II secretory pathway pseudopilin PulG